MGCICSYFKKKDEIDETVLFSNRYCIKCNKVFTPSGYHKHIYKCNQENRNKERFKHLNI